MKKLYCLLIFALVFGACSDIDHEFENKDEEENSEENKLEIEKEDKNTYIITPTVKMLPEKILVTTTPMGEEPSDRLYEIGYDENDRIISINSTTIHYISDNDIETINQEKNKVNYKIQENYVYKDGEKKIGIDSKGKPVEILGQWDSPVLYTYYESGNLSTISSHPWNGETPFTNTYISDKRFNPFYYVQSPYWLLDELFKFEFGYLSNISKIYYDNDANAGYDFKMEYNEEGYPVYIHQSSFGLIGPGITTVTIEY